MSQVKEDFKQFSWELTSLLKEQIPGRKIKRGKLLESLARAHGFGNYYEFLNNNSISSYWDLDLDPSIITNFLELPYQMNKGILDFWNQKKG